jgi:hypothetical protein
MLFKKANLFNETRPVLVMERAFTLKRKLIVGMWTVLLIMQSFISAVWFASYDAGVDWYFHISYSMLTNIKFVDPHPSVINIPVTDWGRYLMAALSLWVGLKLLRAILVQPLIGIHRLRLAKAVRLGEPTAE